MKSSPSLPLSPIRSVSEDCPPDPRPLLRQQRPDSPIPRVPSALVLPFEAVEAQLNDPKEEGSQETLIPTSYTQPMFIPAIVVPRSAEGSRRLKTPDHEPAEYELNVEQPVQSGSGGPTNAEVHADHLRESLPADKISRQIHQGRFGNLPVGKRNKVTLLKLLHLSEDNARFLLLGIILALYAVIGAFIFMLLESGTEIEELKRRLEMIKNFRRKNPNVSKNDLNQLLEVKLFLHNSHNMNPYVQQNSLLQQHYPAGEAASLIEAAFSNSTEAAGRLHTRWTFSGSLYFVYTLMTTTGFGMTTPRTRLGRAITVVYGFFGCTCTILYFNLFLERVITLLTFVITSLHNWADRKRLFRRRSDSDAPNLGLLGLFATNTKEVTNRLRQASIENGNRPGKRAKIQWKPSLYAVFSVLFFMSTSAVFFCSVIFTFMEDTWSFVDSVYASFIAFATIGFGDFVPAFGISSSNKDNMFRPVTPEQPFFIHSPLPNIRPIVGPPTASAAALVQDNPNAEAKENQYGVSDLYRIVTIFALAFGTCCYYSLFNVSSILVKRFLTVVVARFDIDITTSYYKFLGRMRWKKIRITANNLSGNKLSESKLNETELRRRKSVIALLRAAAVDRAMTRYGHSDRLSSDASSKTALMAGRNSRRSTMALPNTTSMESTFSPATSFTNIESSGPLSAGISQPQIHPPRSVRHSISMFGGLRHGRDSISGKLRGRPKPLNVHPSVVDSDDEDDEWIKSSGDLEDTDNIRQLTRDMAVRSEAIKKVGMMKNNAIVLALMQKELHNEQMRQQQLADEQSIGSEANFAGQPVGPLAIAKNMFD